MTKEIKITTAQTNVSPDLAEYVRANGTLVRHVDTDPAFSFDYHEMMVSTDLIKVENRIQMGLYNRKVVKLSLKR